MFATINKEKYHSKVAGIFNDESTTHSAKETLIDYGHFTERHINIITPHDNDAGHKIEPETHAIGKLISQSHFLFGSIGFLFGLLLASLLSSVGPTFAQSSPMLTHMALAIIGIFLGFIIAGVISLRPDHDPLINDAIEATQQNKWALIVQAEESGDRQRARQLLQPIAVSVSETY